MVIKIQLKFLKKSNNIINKEQHQIKVIKSLTEKKFNHIQYSHTPKKQKKRQNFFITSFQTRNLSPPTPAWDHI